MKSNNDNSSDKIRFNRGLRVELTDLMDAYTGTQDLSIDGRGGTVSGESYPAEDIELGGWAEALFRSETGAGITLRNVTTT